jgi:hypothetical protein
VAFALRRFVCIHDECSCANYRPLPLSHSRKPLAERQSRLQSIREQTHACVSRRLGKQVSKRWCANAILDADGHYTASEPTPVGDPTLLLNNLRAQAGAKGIVLAGFDFPIGVPAHYANRAGISRFRDFLPQLGKGDWSEFYKVCDKPEEISVYRPFYPNGKYNECRMNKLFDGHGVTSIQSLLRQSEMGGNGRTEACCLFWTIGGKQVGKAALIGWRDVLVPALKYESTRLWPFDGALQSLFMPGNVVIAETYPAECYGWFSKKRLGSKGNPENRKAFNGFLMDWAGNNGVIIEDSLKQAMRDGFPNGDDAFDAVIGLFGMLQICLGLRDSGEPEDETIREIEGWILGRQSRPVEQVPRCYSANNDPELTDWIRWASESGEVSNFVQAIAEGAFLAELPNYALLRPVLLELMRESALISTPLSAYSP